MTVRSLLALALAAVLAPAAASAAPTSPAPAKSGYAQSRSSYGSGMEGLSIGGFVGYETDDVSGLSLRLDGELPFQALSPQVKMSFVGSFGYSRLTDEDAGADSTANVIKVIPAVRLTFPLNPQFSLFADGGLGLYYADWSVEVPTFPGLPAMEVDDDEIHLMMRIGGGVFFNVNPNTRIGAAIELDPFFGDFDQTTFIIQAGAMFRI